MVVHVILRPAIQCSPTCITPPLHAFSTGTVPPGSTRTGQVQGGSVHGPPVAKAPAQDSLPEPPPKSPGVAPSAMQLSWEAPGSPFGVHR